MVHFSDYRSLIQFVTYQGYYFLNLVLHSDNEDLKQKSSIFAITLKGRLLSAKKIYKIYYITQNTSKIKNSKFKTLQYVSPVIGIIRGILFK